MNIFGYWHFFYPERLLPLHSMLVNCGRERVTRADGYRWDGRKRGAQPMQIWQYTTGGVGAIDLPEGTVKLRPGMAFYAGVPGEHVYYLPDDSEEWSYVFASFEGAETARIAEETRKHFGMIYGEAACARPLAVIMDLINDCCRGVMPDAGRASIIAYTLAMEIFIGARNHTTLPTSSLNLKEDVADFIISHISEPLDVELLARHFGFSRSHFTKKFSRMAGIGPGSFLEELRLDFALRLMLTERKSVKEAAAASGFSDASYFCRRFRGRYGTSPSQYIAAASNGKDGPERA